LSLMEIVLTEGRARIREAVAATEASIAERERLTGEVTASLEQLETDKHAAFKSLDEYKQATDVGIDAAIERADTSAQNVEAERSATEEVRLATKQSKEAADLSADNAATQAEYAADQGDYAKAQGDYAAAEAEDARTQKEEVARVLEAGPVASVNGKTGVVTGLAEQSAVDDVKRTLAETALKADLDALIDRIKKGIELSEPLLISRNTSIPVGGYELKKPAQLTKAFPSDFKIYKQGSSFGTNYDVSKLKNTSGVTYYVSPTGLDTNDGLTEATPLKMIKTAYDKSDVGTIILLDGDYHFRANILGSGNFFIIDKNINFIAKNSGKAHLYSGLNIGWTKTAGYTNVYEGNVGDTAKVVAVIDSANANEYGEKMRYVKVNSLAECDATPNSMYTDATKVYLHTFNNRAPEYGVTAVLWNELIPIDGFSSNDFNLYLEGIRIYGGSTAARCRANKVGHKTNFIAKNTVFAYAAGSNNALTGLGGNYYLQNCVAKYSALSDGFNYHKSTVTNEIGFVIEINCIAYQNGVDAADNGSTLHDGYEGIRLLGSYWGNAGRNIADINPGTVSWNVGCITAKSLLSDDVTAHVGSTVILEGHIVPEPSKLIVETGATLINNNPSDAVKISDSPLQYKYF
jgi:hypothetical protein